MQVLITSSKDAFLEMTDVQGNFKHQVSPEINYNVKFVIPCYQPQGFEKVKLNRCEHERLRIFRGKLICDKVLFIF